MYDRDRTITAWYKIFSKITRTIDDFEDGDYTNNPAWDIDCGGSPFAEIVPGYNSNYALRIRSIGWDGLACAITPYNAISGKKITYACYGSRCRMCVYDGVKCINNPEICGSNLADWTICETTVTETNPNAHIYVYNDDEVNHWSVYDILVEEPIFEYDGTEISGNLLDERSKPIIQEGTYHPTCTSPTDSTTVLINRNVKLEYYDGSWHNIGSATSSVTDGSWDYSWSCVLGATKLRASYNPTNWYYGGANTEIPITCAVPECINDMDCCEIAGGPCTKGARCTSGNCVCCSPGIGCSSCPV